MATKRFAALGDVAPEMILRVARVGVDPVRTVAVACELTEPEGFRFAQLSSLKPSARCGWNGSVFVVLLSVFDALAVFCGDDLAFAFEIVTRLDPKCRMLPYIECDSSCTLSGIRAGSNGQSRRAPILGVRDQRLEAALELALRRIQDHQDAMERAPDGWDEECSARADDVDAALAVLIEYCKSSA